MAQLPTQNRAQRAADLIAGGAINYYGLDRRSMDEYGIRTCATEGTVLELWHFQGESTTKVFRDGVYKRNGLDFIGSYWTDQEALEVQWIPRLYRSSRHLTRLS
jgi:hypothetical protein